MESVTLYHNPACSKSRDTLALIRAAGIEPTVIDYLQNPLSRNDLEALRRALDLPAACLLRTGDTRYTALGLDAPDCSDEQRMQALVAEPSLFNRPVVVSACGARICRPPETVLEILPK
jgi:arsenate reductase